MKVRGEVYLKVSFGGREAKHSLDNYVRFYNNQRHRQALDYQTPAEVFNGDLAGSAEDKKREDAVPWQRVGRTRGDSGALTFD